MGNRRDYLINSIVDICHKIDTKGWVANHDGNVTVKYEDNFLATPTSVSKSDMVSEMVLTLDKSGNKIHGVGKSFSEMKLHLAAYGAREEINAVIHAHPPFATAFGLIGEKFIVNLPEAIVSIGDEIPVAGYSMPGTEKSINIVSELIMQTDVFMIAGNGVLAVGKDLNEAFLRMELLEHLVKINYYAKSMGTPMSIPEGDRQKLIEKRISLGLITKEKNFKSTPDNGEQKNEILKNLISEEIKKVLLEQ